MRRARLLGLILLYTVPASALLVAPSAPPQSDPAPELSSNKTNDSPIKSLAVPDDAIRLALADVLAASTCDRPFLRYVWVPDGHLESVKVVAMTLNYISRGVVLIRPVPIAGGQLVRVDLRWYAPRDEDLVDWMRTWEELQFDPMFALLLTKDTLDFALRSGVPLSTRRSKRSVLHKAATRTVTQNITHPGGDFAYPDDSGRIHRDLAPGTYSVELEFRTGPVGRIDLEEFPIVVNSVDVVRLNAAHINPGAFDRLQELTHSLAPVVHHLYFETRVLTTIKDKGLFRVVFGGLYYEFRGIKKSKDTITDEDLFFANLGVQAGVFDRLRSDQRLAMFRSMVTGKARRVDMFHTLAGRATTGWGAITHDIRDQDVDIGTQPIMNLIAFKDAAREAIFETQSGMPIFALFNGAGALQDEVPPDVAMDRTIPAPYTMRLQPAISCIRCHGIDGSDGWKPLINDVRRLLARRLDVFTDLTDLRKSTPDVIDRLAGLYAGDFSKHLNRARDDYAETLLKATGPWKQSVDQTDVARLSAQLLADQYEAYNYRLVDPQQALVELGFRVPRDQAVAILAVLLPPDQRSQLGFIIPEDPRIGALLNGLSINRSDWALVYAFAAERAQKNSALLLKKGLKP